MIALYIILGVLAFIFIILLLPLTLEIAYDKEFLLKVKFFGICLYDNKSIKKDKKKIKNNKKSYKKSEEIPAQKDGFLKSTYKQKGFTGTVVYLSEILKLVLIKIKWLLPRIKFHKFVFELTVATSDAADTAIKYGKVCSAVYPVFAFVQSNTPLKTEQINISADFDKKISEFKTSIKLTAKALWLLIAAISVLWQFLKLQRKEREKYERKQLENSNGHNDGQTAHNGGC